MSDEDDEENAASGVVMGEQQMAQAYRIIEGLGGSANIKEANNCLTRLRVDIVDASLV